MADRNHQPQKPITNRRDKFSSDSNQSKSHNPKPSNPISNCRNDTVSAHQDFPALMGSCPFMCPVEERIRRERLRDLSVLERLHGNPAKTSPTLAVKKFCRTISTREMQASDLRPIPVLESTLNYLLNLMHSEDHPFEVVHDFIFDRTRSIRQDLSMQNAVGDRVIHMYERMVKFHIVSRHHLQRSCGTPNAASLYHLNAEQLMKSLTTLLNLYEANRADSHSTFLQSEAEFYSHYLLLHLDSKNQGEPLSLWLRRIPSPIMKSREMRFARRILRLFSRYYRMGNYKRFIHTTENEASFLQYCIIEPYINEVRILALSCISYGGYKMQAYPLVQLSKILMMEESEVENLCTDCALETSSDGATGKGLMSTKQLVVNKSSSGPHKYYPMNSERVHRLYAELPEL
ncbi:hypothetical protein ABFX02_14G179100 [Erythranthe guttata]